MVQGEPLRRDQIDARGRLRLAATCCVAMFLYASYLGAISVLLPAIGKTFNLGPETQGRLFPANFMGYTFGVLGCGALSDRYGRKRVILLGIAGYAAGLALFGSVPVFGATLVASVLVGAGSGAMEAVASALASDLYPERRAFILNAMQVAFGAGAAISPALAQAVLSNGVDWRLLYYGLATANVMLFVLLAFQRVPASLAPIQLDLRALHDLIRQPAFGLLCLAQALYVGAETGYFSWMPTYFEHDLPRGAAWAGWIVSVFWIAITLGRLITVLVIERTPLMRLNLLLCGGAAFFAASTLTSGRPPIVMVWVALTGLCYSSIFGLILAEAGERFPSLLGTVYGSVVASGGVGGAIVPWLVGSVASTSAGWRGALTAIPVLCVSIGAISVWLHRNRESR